jgi:hypothetical protein
MTRMNLQKKICKKQEAGPNEKQAAAGMDAPPRRHICGSVSIFQAAVKSATATSRLAAPENVLRVVCALHRVALRAHSFLLSSDDGIC